MLGHLIAGRAEALGGSLELRPSLCTAMRYPRSGCRACMEACTVDALRLDGKGWIVNHACDGCGACVPACPTGALDLRAPGMADLEAGIRRKHAESPGEDVFLACERCKPRPREAFVMPCAARLDEAALVHGPLRGSGRVCVLLGDCRDCSRKERFLRVFGAVLRTARAILEASGLDRNHIRAGRPGTLEEGKTHRRGKGASRRDFFQLLARSALAPGSASPSEKENPSLGKRRRLVESIRAGGRKFAAGAPKGVPLGSVSLSDECLGCPVCAHVCAPGAITREEAEDGTVTFRFDPALCHACGACAEACMPKAVTLKTSQDSGVLSSRTVRTLATLARKECSSCGEVFASARADLCPRCRRFPTIQGEPKQGTRTGLRPDGPKAEATVPGR
jgi:ferredoxin